MALPIVSNPGFTSAPLAQTIKRCGLPTLIQKCQYCQAIPQQPREKDWSNKKKKKKKKEKAEKKSDSLYCPFSERAMYD